MTVTPPHLLEKAIRNIMPQWAMKLIAMMGPNEQVLAPYHFKEEFAAVRAEYKRLRNKKGKRRMAA